MTLSLVQKLRLDEIIKSYQLSQYYNRENLVSDKWFTVEENPEKRPVLTDYM